ncbi:MAG TPA: FAD-binding oxidoreductase [Anaeromyxobacter sp.]|nr:FAD-binding oxidoreductase [Anaeromyxobacter sp.]
MARTRRVGAWGFEGERYDPSPALLEWLAGRLGPAEPFPRVDPAAAALPPARPLPRLGAAASADPRDRLAHARGQGLPDLLRVRSGRPGAAPDAVVRPGDEAEVAATLAACAAAGVLVVPWGGGTSVTGGANAPGGDRPAIALDLERLAGLSALDERSGLATFGAGTFGPDLEAALARRGLTLGHFPQSFELSTLGGWIATRSSGQESVGYGGVAELVAGVALVAPGGRLDLPAFPGTAAGPDLREVVLGSEGRLGVVTRATVRVRERRPPLRVTGTLVPSWEAGLDAARALLRGGAGLSLLRLSDEAETEVGVTLGLRGHRIAGAAARAWLALRRVPDRACLVLAGAPDDRAGGRALDEAAAILRERGGVGLGDRPGRRWLADRYRHPYLRDALLDRGVAVETVETAAPWSRLDALSRAVKSAIEGALARDRERGAVLCHVSHAYLDGASLYFTFFFRCPSDPDAAVARWAALKRAATRAIVEGGGTLSHHHGVGAWHAPWLGREVGADGVRVLGAVAGALDPAGVMNPRALLDPADRLDG